MTPQGTIKAMRARYDLIANTVHEGEPREGKGTYKARVLHKVWLSLVVNCYEYLCVAHIRHWQSHQGGAYPFITYDLVATMAHEGEAGEGKGAE